MSDSRKVRISLREWRSKHWEEEREGRLEELRERFGQKCREAQALDLQAKELMRRLLDLQAKELMRRLVEAIGRHEPMANDPAVIDAINAVEDALRQKEETPG